MGNWILMWTENGKNNDRTFEDKTENYEAIKNELSKLKARKERGEITGLKGLRPDGTAVLFNEAPNMTWGLKVSFGTKKTYQYESPEEIALGEEVVVDPDGILKFAKVIECTKMERSALVAQCNGKRLRMIIAKVTRVKKGA